MHWLTPGKISQRSGLPVSTLHFYEAQGLIRSLRTDGNQRRYHQSVLRRLGIISFAQKFGIPLAGIRDAMADLPQDRPLSAADWERLATSWADDLDRRIAGLARLRESLTDCIGCGCLSTEACPLRNPDDRLARLGKGPRRLLGGQPG